MVIGATGDPLSVRADLLVLPVLPDAEAARGLHAGRFDDILRRPVRR